MSDVTLNADVSVVPQVLEADFADESEIDTQMDVAVNLGGTKDYKKLINKPTINGTELVDNYNEIDPTVPNWAKADNKPSYTAQEVGAVDETSKMTRTDIHTVWEKYFV